MSNALQELLKYLKIDFKTLNDSSSLDQYICKMVDNHIRSRDFESYDDFKEKVECEGVGYYQLHYDPVEGLTVELLDLWMDKLVPALEKPMPTPEELEKIMDFLRLEKIDIGALLRSGNIEEYLNRKIELHLEKESMVMETFKKQVSVLNAMDYQDRSPIDGITGEMLKWWCMLEENE